MHVKKLPQLAINGLLAIAIIAALIVVKQSDPDAESTPCPPPRKGERLIVTGSADGKPFCAYHPIPGWGMVR